MKNIKEFRARRQFLKFIGRGTAGLFATSLLAACARTITKTAPPKVGLAASTEDTIHLQDGLTYNVVAKWQDPINRKESFGFNNDFIASVVSPQGEQFLWINHESPDPHFVSNYTSGTKTQAQFKLEAQSVGGSFVRVNKYESGWRLEADERNFRLDGLTKIPFAWPHPIAGSNFAIGTLSNCAGGLTPWGTILTCEENYQEYYGETWLENNKRQTDNKSKFGWHEIAPQPSERYGWVVEISPWKKTAKKLVALGRFAHENACVVVSKEGYPVVYMGDDTDNQFIYKFVARKKGSLEEGELFVADSKNGKWLSMSWEKQPLLKKTFASQTEVLIYARQAAKLLGATPQNRPEDIELDKKTGAIFVSLTNNKTAGDAYGQIAKIEELDGYMGQSFRLSTFLMGGRENDFACPDNLVFDPKGNLWFTVDMSESMIGSFPYDGFGNNSLYVVPASGTHAGLPIRVATCPVDAEFTGPCFSPDAKTLFLSVQHPGSRSHAGKFTSHWPEGGDAMPRPAVIAIQGPLLDSYTQV